MSQPYFSIITCTYNSEQFLQQCIESVKFQSFADYEHIFVDANSSDRTAEMLEAYAREDPRVRIIRAEPKGIANAMNRGIEEAGGTVVQHLHSDDYYHSESSLQVVADTFQKHPRLTMVIGLCSRNIDGKFQSGLLPSSTFKRRSLLLKYLIYVHCYIAHPSTFIKKSVFDKHGLFDESFQIAMDYEFWLRALGKESYVMLNQELTTFRHHAAAASSDHKKNMADENRARQLHARGFRSNVARVFFSRAVSIKEKQNRKKA